MKVDSRKHHLAIGYCAGFARGLHDFHTRNNIALIETQDLEHIVYTIIFEYCREMGIEFICPDNEFYELAFPHIGGSLDDRHFEPNSIHYYNLTIAGWLKWAEVLVSVWHLCMESVPNSEAVVAPLQV
jgi:hypothetical protein